VNDGLNASPAQFVTWNGLDTGALAPSALVIVPVMLIGSQLVGLNVKPLRSIVTLTCWICRGIPSMICGNGSVVTVICAVRGSTSIFARVTIVPRLN
jgi:hypothetical protein